MNFSLDDIELIDRYIRKELSSDELLAFNSRLKDQEFAAEVNSHIKSLEVIKFAGRQLLASQLKTIQQNIETSDGYQKYKPSHNGKGFFGNGLMSVIIIGIIATTCYFYFSGSLVPDKIDFFNNDSATPDTVYHYNIKKDTIILNNRHARKSDTIRTIRYDTTYVKTYVPLNGSDKFGKEEQPDTIIIRKNIN